MAETLKQIAERLAASDKKVQLIYAFNGSGKTRLSRALKAEVDPKDENIEEPRQAKLLYYNAFTEDLFHWDNDLESDTERKLLIKDNAYTSLLFDTLGLQANVIETFKRYTRSVAEPLFSSDNKSITFPFKQVLHTESENPEPIQTEQGDLLLAGTTNIKISRGEESNLVWSIFHTMLVQALEELSNDKVEDRIDPAFDKLTHVFIDDPVSSLDDNHLIRLAVDIATLIKKDESPIRYVVTTHNPLFFNVIQKELSSKDEESGYKPRQSKMWILKKDTADMLDLVEVGKDRPFAYHLFLLREIKRTIASGQVEKYHFALLRNVLEKTATFLGHNSWGTLVDKGDDPSADAYSKRLINLSTHSQHSGEDVSLITDADKQTLAELVDRLVENLGFNVGDVT